GAEEDRERLGRVARVERQEEHAQAEPEGQDRADRDVAVPQADPESADADGRQQRPGQEARDRVEPEEDGAGRAGEADLGQPVDGEGEVAHDHVGADQPGDDGDHDAGHQRVLDEGVMEELDQGWWSWWKPPGSPTSESTMTRPSWRITATGDS